MHIRTYVHTVQWNLLNTKLKGLINVFMLSEFNVIGAVTVGILEALNGHLLLFVLTKIMC